MTQTQQSLQNSMTIWANPAISTGVVSSFFLLLKKTKALPVFNMSLVAALIQIFNFIILMKGFNPISQGGKL